ncbi:14c8645d-f080-4bc1-9731-ca05c6f1fd2d [Sclerotinia trifoliorum]|uniref:14c8645d-f080-4bc1-9731-ca05c6f1fd2d n=1 Tax=Sclerotinia trifoliorum TaxID=28548 RepID=A0A8H2ZRD6_9HELO|nr:14c8645d-f080-4bc1-9731-ca05c6f1fd2d [Sclerotinia trifoliorum]
MRGPGDDSPIEVFSCDHIIIDTFAQVIQELDRGGAGKRSLGDQRLTSLPLQVGECLKNMLRAVQARPGPKKGEICVSWADNEAEKLFRLHDIEHADNDFEKDSEDEMEAWKVCQCLQKIVNCTTVDNEVTFSDLVLTQSYFPMISRAHPPVAFFGLPPPAQKPAVQQSKLVLKLHSTKQSAFIPEAKNEKSCTGLGESSNHIDDEHFWIPNDKPKKNYPTPEDTLDCAPFPGFANRSGCTGTSSQPFGGRTGFERWKEELGVARDLQKVQSELQFTQKTLKVPEMEHRDMSQQNAKLKLQMADDSAE